MDGPGYVYGAINQYMPDIVKIGMTSRHPLTRLTELSNGSVPGEFELAFSFYVAAAGTAERMAHILLRDHRIASGKEFFSINEAQAKLITSIISSSRGWWFKHQSATGSWRSGSIEKH